MGVPRQESPEARAPGLFVYVPLAARQRALEASSRKRNAPPTFGRSEVLYLVKDRGVSDLVVRSQKKCL
jgi:hypothetical protein